MLKEVGVDHQEKNRNSSVKDLLVNLVQIRNKTKAHGAVGQDFYLAVNDSYNYAVSTLVQSCPALSWRWIHFLIRETGKVRGLELMGLTPRIMKDAEIAAYIPETSGVYFIPERSTRAFFCGDLIQAKP